ncbi:MAG: hypothetical protein IPK68_11175 [Bdellovibrionales bacterium]|nr:hypothetical protein [Bdellovibrionales bacterium]
MKHKNNTTLETYSLLGALIGLMSEVLTDDEKDRLDNVRRRKKSSVVLESEKLELNFLAATLLLRVIDQNPDSVIKEQ